MNAPTLLIGLGGTGCKIIENVSNMVTEEQRDSIAFAVFDTDINDLRGIQQRNPFIKIIQTSTKQSVGEYLNKDTHARDSWFPVNAILNGKTLTEGAGQVRSISRLALETVIRAGKMEPLHDAIQSLYKVEEDKVEQALRVVIVSSLAGGTGSGLILPVAMYVRNYLKTHFRQSANITRGFFILPEVFYEVIPGQTERNNLKANAYATLRELDAFLMKGDNTLDERFSDYVKLEFPRIAADGYEEYEVRPYDFCFLFDAQNAEGGKLNSFDQYLEHAANCIYAQSIGPMNKRSNSSEDNTIRKLAKERGRNRYAGAGASMLIYPFEDIRNLIALKWAKQCVSKQWMAYDYLYKDMCKENEKRRELGMGVREQTLSAFYANKIETGAKHDDPFAKSIDRACGRYEDGVTRIADNWEEYADGVAEKLATDLNDLPSDLNQRFTSARNMVFALEADWEDYINAYTQLQAYKLRSDVYVEEVAQSIGYSLFKGAHSNNDGNEGYKLETYLKNNENEYIHPNAIRYLLIKILNEFGDSRETAKNSKETNRKFFETFEKQTFDDPDTEEEEGVQNLRDRAEGKGLKKLSKKSSADQEDIKNKYVKYLNTVKEFRDNSIKEAVYTQGLDYIKGLLNAFEGFYKSLESKVETLDRRIQEIYKKNSSVKGNTVRYVCASAKCLDKIYEKKPYTGSTISIDSQLSKKIYDKILAYALADERPNINRYFSDLFDVDIIGYFEKSVMDNYGEDLDIDIISAIEKEADYEGKYEDEDDAYSLIQQYVIKTIRDTRNLSLPFIESPLGEAREPINACTFNTSLKPDRGDDSPRAQLIRAELMNYGGAPDEDISKYMIMFYQSFYGLRANDLSKFAPPEKSITYNRSSGEYYKAYYELVRGIHPEPHKSKEISPHIDRWWHIISKMPDLDEDSQKEQEYNVYAAFFWAMVRGYIYITAEGSDSMIYQIREERLKMDDSTLIVSNGTDCDKFYEVLDAIAIYPELVGKILENVAIDTKADINDSIELEDGILMTGLRNFSLAEPGIGASHLPAKSIFDIPMLMKKSAIPELYYERNVVEMLRVEIEEIKRYISNFCTAKELPELAGKVIIDQYHKHLASLEQEKTEHASIYRESLFTKTADIIINALSEIGLKQEARAINEEVEQLKNAN